jgi:hypothetical protein
MPHPRLQLRNLTPEYEDAGLFKNEICQVRVALVPIVDHNSRGDVNITGFVKDDLEISVSFAGRRRVEVSPIVANLKSLGMRVLHAAAQNGVEAPDVRTIRFPLQVEGAWRPRFQSDPSGWERRTYHLIAARWAVMDRNGKTMKFGAPPLTARA